MSKVTQTRDVQAQTFGFAANVASAYAVGESRACTISSLVVTGVSTVNHASNDAAGMILLASIAATFDSAASNVVYGVVQSNTSGTSSAFTVDAWYNLAGAQQTNTVANSGDYFILLPIAAPFWYIALTDSTSAVAGTETGAALGGTELTSNGLTRALADVVTRTVGSTTATMAHTFTYTGSTAQNIGRCAITNSIVASKNYAYFIDQVNSGTPATVSANGDTFTPTYTITVG